MGKYEGGRWRKGEGGELRLEQLVLVSQVQITSLQPPLQTKKTNICKKKNVKPRFEDWNWEQAASRTSEVKIYTLRCLLTTPQLKRSAPTLTPLSAKTSVFSARPEFTLLFRQKRGMPERKGFCKLFFRFRNSAASSNQPLTFDASFCARSRIIPKGREGGRIVQEASVVSAGRL